MNRRQAIKGVALLIGGTAAVSTFGVMTQSCSGGHGDAAVFDDTALELMDAVCDTLIPETDVPGAKAAGVGQFVVMMLEECHSAEERVDVTKGLAELNAAARKRYDDSFSKLALADREGLLKALEQDEAPYFGLIKRLANQGYYTSEVGATKALAFDFIPGGYNGCLPLQEGQRAWAM